MKALYNLWPEISSANRFLIALAILTAAASGTKPSHTEAGLWYPDSMKHRLPAISIAAVLIVGCWLTFCQKPRATDAEYKIFIAAIYHHKPKVVERMLNEYQPQSLLTHRYRNGVDACPAILAAAWARIPS